MRKTLYGNTQLDKFDVIVIGSGAGGGPIAHVLAAAGQKVLVLEAGPCHFDNIDDPAHDIVARFSNDELKIERRNFMLQNENVEPRTWRTAAGDGPRIETLTGNVQFLPKTVGGGSVHADLKMPRFESQDFQFGTLLKNVQNASFADWPVQYDELEPFYAWGERLLGVQGKLGSNPFESKRSGEYPMPPGPPMYGSLVVQKGLSALGYTMFPYPTAVNSIPYDGRPPCNNCGFCSSYGCPINAKGSSAVTVLRKALLTGNCQLRAETRVVRLVANGSGTAITGVETIDPLGARVTFTADRFVLAASPIEDVRLLLLSGGLGNSSGMVGRNLMFHYQTIAFGIYGERVHGYRGRAVAQGFADFRGKPNDAAHPLAGITEISGGGLPVGEASYYARVLAQAKAGKWNGKLFKALMRESPARDRVMLLVVQAEDAPQVTNIVDLDPDYVDLDGLPVPRCTYKSHPFEVANGQFYEPKLLDIMMKSGARYAAITPRDDVPSSQHIMGTLRFGNDPKTSVCDKNGKFHDIGNLFASDGALFPTSSGYNPTMTIATLALRVGAAMVNPASPASVIKP